MLPPVNVPCWRVVLFARIESTSAVVWLRTVFACGCVRCEKLVVLCSTGSRFGVIAPTC